MESVRDGRDGGADAQSSHLRQEGSRSARVLIVDDSPTIRDLVRRTLQFQSYAVVEATDGANALAVLEQDKDFEVLILDLAMPRLDGYSLIRRIRQDPSYPRFRILVLSAEELDLSVQPLVLADAIIAKPFRPSDLLQTMGRLMALPRG